MNYILLFILLLIVTIIAVIVLCKKSNFANINKINDKIVVGFMIRDGDKYIQKNLDRIIAFLQNNFNTFEIIYIENDSKDKTIQILNEYRMKYPFIKGEHLVLKNNYSTNMCLIRNCTNRFQFLASLRQKLLDKVLSIYKFYNYYLLLDLDFIDYDDSDLLNMTKIMLSKKYDAIFPNSINNIVKNDKINILYDYGAIMPQKRSFFNRFTKKENKVEKVESAFSGFGLYSIDAIKYNSAKYNLECNDIEHIDFNNYLKNVYVYHGFNPVYE